MITPWTRRRPPTTAEREAAAFAVKSVADSKARSKLAANLEASFAEREEAAKQYLDDAVAYFACDPPAMALSELVALMAHCAVTTVAVAFEPDAEVSNRLLAAADQAMRECARELDHRHPTPDAKGMLPIVVPGCAICGVIEMEHEVPAPSDAAPTHAYVRGRYHGTRADGSPAPDGREPGMFADVTTLAGIRREGARARGLALAADVAAKIGNGPEDDDRRPRNLLEATELPADCVACGGTGVEYDEAAKADGDCNACNGTGRAF